jgi:hypothetical protein
MNEYYPNNVLQIPNATPETKDAAQYIMRHGRKQWNLCGEFCVAFCMRDEYGSDNIEDYLNYWQAKTPSLYNSLFYNGLGRTTGIYDLTNMLTAYGTIGILPFNKVIMSPYVVQAQLEQYQAIVGVQIDYSGYLVGKGIPHWIVLDNIMVIDDTHAIVDIFNPYTNAHEPYSWKELMTSTGAYKQGLWVER